MSRWSEEEDKYILEFIQEVDEEINYSELVTSHNKTFNTKRTEIAYKTRLAKIAKENNIILKSNKFWTEKEKETIKLMVQNNPIDIKWEEISKQINRSEDSIKRTYMDCITAKEHINMCINKINNEMISTLISSSKKYCSNCKSVRFTNLCIWKENEYCEACYDVMFKEEVENRWKLANKYSIENNKVECNICNKKAILNNTILSKFHYDHIDMFDKTSSICEMISTGVPIEDIYNEINKCQLLCISCHKMVTKIENQIGFIRFKKQITKDYNDTNDIIQKEELKKEYSKIYNEFMNKVYAILKEETN